MKEEWSSVLIINTPLFLQKGSGDEDEHHVDIVIQEMSKLH